MSSEPARPPRQLGFALEHVQSNHEGVLVDAIHAARNRCAAIVINPGAFTHYAWAIHDALATFDGPVVELHLSNPNAREPWRHTSVVAPVAKGSIVGFGGHGYVMAIDAVGRLARSRLVTSAARPPCATRRRPAHRSVARRPRAARAATRSSSPTSPMCATSPASPGRPAC